MHMQITVTGYNGGARIIVVFAVLIGGGGGGLRKVGRVDSVLQLKWGGFFALSDVVVGACFG